MFFTYLRRELRRRMRQAIFISLGLALGIGLVITVTAASSGVKDAQGTVLQNLYGVGTAATVTTAPTRGSFALGGAELHVQAGRDDQARRADRDTQPRQPERHGRDHDLEAERRGRGGRCADGRQCEHHVQGARASPRNAAAAAAVAVAAAEAAAVAAAAATLAGSTARARSALETGDGQRRRSLLGRPAARPAQHGTLSSGRTLKSADASANVAVVDSSYAKSDKLKTGSDVTIAGTKFTVVGIVTRPAG